MRNHTEEQLRALAERGAAELDGATASELLQWTDRSFPGSWAAASNMADAVLVAHRDKVQDIKGIVSSLKRAGRPEPTWHRKVYRPWGSYDSIDMGGRFQVKRITVKPGAALSLQMHHHRAEHWIVVSGTGKVTRGDDTILLAENQSTYIPLGVKHRLENPGRVPLELIEVQSGSYLGEDDIVRFEDVYGRG